MEKIIGWTILLAFFAALFILMAIPCGIAIAAMILSLSILATLLIVWAICLIF
jgi:hypothetical protein